MVKPSQSNGGDGQAIIVSGERDEGHHKETVIPCGNNADDDQEVIVQSGSNEVGDHVTVNSVGSNKCAHLKIVVPDVSSEECDQEIVLCRNNEGVDQEIVCDSSGSLDQEMVVPGGSKEGDAQEMFVPGGSKEGDAQEMFVPGGSKEEDAQEMFVPGGSKEEDAQEMFVPGGSKEGDAQEMFVPGGSKEGDAQEMFVPGGSKEGDAQEMVVPVGSKEEDAQEMIVPGGSKEGDAQEMFVPVGSKEEDAQEMIVPGGSKEGDAQEMFVPVGSKEGDAQEMVVPGVRIKDSSKPTQTESGTDYRSNKQRLLEKHDRYVEETQKNKSSKSKYFVSESLHNYPRVNQVDLENSQNLVGPLKAKRGRKRIRAESLEHESSEDICTEGDEIGRASVSIELNGLKLIDSQSSSSDEDESRERLDYNNITEFFVETNACKIKSPEKGKVKTLKDISLAAIKEFPNLTKLLEGIPAYVLDDHLNLLSQLTTKQLFDVEKLFPKKDRLSVTDKFWKTFCGQHFNYFNSENGETYRDIYIKSSRFFRNEARRVDRGVKRRFEKLKKDIDKSVLPDWDKPVSLDEWDANNDDNYDCEYHEIDYPEDSQDFY